MNTNLNAAQMGIVSEALKIRTAAMSLDYRGIGLDYSIGLARGWEDQGLAGVAGALWALGADCERGPEIITTGAMPGAMEGEKWGALAALGARAKNLAAEAVRFSRGVAP